MTSKVASQGAEVRPGTEQEAAAEGRGEEETGASSSVAQELAMYREAARFRRRAGRALRPLGLTFASWRVLEATIRLVAGKGDACNHAEVARDISLDEASVLRTMRLLSKLGWVSHDIASEWNYGFRVIPTASGQAQLDHANRVVAATTTDGSRARFVRRLFSEAR